MGRGRMHAKEKYLITTSAARSPIQFADKKNGLRDSVSGDDGKIGILCNFQSVVLHWGPIEGQFGLQQQRTMELWSSQVDDWPTVSPL
jgi:hypothetical protein